MDNNKGETTKNKILELFDDYNSKKNYKEIKNSINKDIRNSLSYLFLENKIKICNPTKKSLINSKGYARSFTLSEHVLFQKRTVDSILTDIIKSIDYYERDQNDFNELKTLFIDIIRNDEAEKEEIWDEAQENVVYRQLNDEEILFLFSGMDLYSKMDNMGTEAPKVERSEIIDNMKKFRSSLPALRNIYDNLKIFAYKYKSNLDLLDNYLFFTETNKNEKQERSYLLELRSIEKKGVMPDWMILFESTNKPSTKDNFLISQGYQKPSRKSDDEITDDLIVILKFISNQEVNKKNELKYELARCLSNEEDVYGVTAIERLNKLLLEAQIGT